MWPSMEIGGYRAEVVEEGWKCCMLPYIGRIIWRSLTFFREYLESHTHSGHIWRAAECYRHSLEPIWRAQILSRFWALVPGGAFISKHLGHSTRSMPRRSLFSMWGNAGTRSGENSDNIKNIAPFVYKPSGLNVSHHST